MHEFGRRLRADRLAAYSDFLAAMTEFRRAEIVLSRRESADPDGAATAAADADSWRLRGAGLTSVSRVRLLAANRDVVDAANKAYAATGAIREGDPADVTARGDAAYAALNAFVEVAANEVQAPLAARSPDRALIRSP